MCDYDFIFEFLVIGDCNVGKSSFVYQYCENFKTKIRSRERGDGNTFIPKLIRVDDKNCFLKFVKYYKRVNCLPNYRFINIADCIFILFDVCNRESFDNVGHYYNEILKYSSENLLITLIGCKADLLNREVDQNEALEFSKKHNIPYFEVNNFSPSEIEKNVYQQISQTILPELVNINSTTQPITENQHPPTKPHSPPIKNSFFKFWIKNK
ncbi:Rab GTPase [Dictyostelium discoideum AX4]|uniref:Rab GTPase n=1 Tax=Dictyostelium discoideum TaxID=44689 RepID=Q54S62_DICDI|nr:Rab GTPase [Dictyostelium discoideum AX4]EAL66186.1 Rab GTPase [Dictyostelium discoideum AX4]|eukprot:XP_640177.1 Rab GTPase [Dictyostelium discoideum AX4]